MKKLSICALVLCIVLTGLLVVGCSPKIKDIKDWESNPIADSDPLYRDYYQIFVYGYADSDGDGIGDLKGIESKLDYIKNLNFNGIWLSPIFPSSQSNHNYDVEDYCAIDKRYGTLEDFDSLVAACHERDIAVMMDQVFNHSSNKHPWFRQAQQALRNGDYDNKYIDYYKFSGHDPDTYAHFETSTAMPKLNLDNEAVRDELDNICKFWIQDHGVDAFRLDAAFHFYGIPEENIAFMQWLMSTARKYNPDVYMVGEVWKGDATVYAHYAEDSVQSFFNFQLSGAPGFNDLMRLVGTETIAQELPKVIAAKEKGTAKGIDALFASNHDTSRVSNTPLSYYSNRQMEFRADLYEKHKMAIALLYTQAGNVFNYYGNEIGLRNGLRGKSGTDYIDHTYRIAMNWGNDCQYDRTDGFAYKAYGYETVYGEFDDVLGGVAEQNDNQNSLLNFYRRLMLLRRQNPEIAQGTSEFLDSGDDMVVIIKRTVGNKSIFLVYNFDSEESRTVDIAKLVADNGLTGTFAGFLSSDNGRDVTYNKGKLTLPQYSVAVIR